MKFAEYEYMFIFTTFLEEDIKKGGTTPRYIRLHIGLLPLWYKATETGFKLVEFEEDFQLEKAYNEQK